MNRLLLAALLASAIVLPLLASSYYITLFSFILLNALVALGLVLLTGVAGLISFGQAAFVGIGAYTTAYLSTRFGMGGLATLACTIALVAASAFVIGRLTLSMGGHYLSLATLAWGLSVYYALGQIQALGGFNGLGGVPVLDLGGITLSTDRAIYSLIAICFALALLGVRNLLDSRLGRAIRALRSGETLPEAFGANSLHLKTGVFVVAAVLAGVSGWLYAYMQRFVNPTPFGLQMGIEYLFMAVMGGAGSIFGSLMGAGVVTILKQQLQDILPHLLGQSGNFESIVFGALMLLVLARANGGIWPFLSRFLPAGVPMANGLHNARPLPRSTGMTGGSDKLLRIAKATKTFGGLTAVNEVSFDVNKGEIVALLGPNGAGKSTLFHLISGVLLPCGGQVQLGGIRIEGLPSRQIARLGLARTFQHVKLVPGLSVLENVAMGCFLRGRGGWLRAMLRLNRGEEAAIREEALKQLQRCGLAELAHEQAGNLALGKQRIVEIARALCGDPVLLLLDEPAAGLRHREKEELAVLLDALRQENMTTLIVDHDMDFIMKISDRLVVMQFGQKIAEGAPASVRNNSTVREAYLGT